MNRTLWSDDVELQVQLALGKTDDVTFTLDHDPRGRLDHGNVLGSPDAPYDDVTCDVRSVTWRQGATRSDGPLTRFEAGTATIVLGNDDGAYDVMQPGTRLVPNVRVRIRARETGATDWIAQWSGFADLFTLQWNDDATDSTVTIACSDGVKLLRAYNAPAEGAAGAGETTAQRVTRILDEANWTQGRRITAGGLAVQATTMAQDAWTLLLANQDAELGATYVDKDGVLVFVPRSVWINNVKTPTIDATFGPDDLRYEDVRIVNDDQNYRNIIDASRTGGSTITKQDNLHVQNYFPHRYGRTDLTLQNDADVNDWCSYVLQSSLSLAPRLDTLVVQPQVKRDSWTVLLNMAFEDAWTIHVANVPGVEDFQRNSALRGWTHEVTPDLWKTTVTLMDLTGWAFMQLDAGNERAQLDAMRLG